MGEKQISTGEVAKISGLTIRTLQHFQTLNDVMDFYNTWKRLSIKSAAFNEAGIEPGDAIAQTLAMEWVEMTLSVHKGRKRHRGMTGFQLSFPGVYPLNL